MFWTTELVSYSCKEVISSFHSNFPLLSLLRVRWKLMKWYKCTCRSGWLSLLLQEAAAQHLWPLFSIFLYKLTQWSSFKFAHNSASICFSHCLYCLQVLDPDESNFVWKSVSKLLFKLVIKNKRHKQLIDHAKPDDRCTPTCTIPTVPFYYH